jgi:hypothetical protein
MISPLSFCVTRINERANCTNDAFEIAIVLVSAARRKQSAPCFVPADPTDLMALRAHYWLSLVVVSAFFALHSAFVVLVSRWNVSVPISLFALAGLHLAFRRVEEPSQKVLEKKTPNRR